MQMDGTEVMDRDDRARGVKRSADDSFDDDQRFAKRFNLLNLDVAGSGKLYIPVSARPQLTQAAPPAHGSPGDGGRMLLDNTKDRVYIHNLDDELADVESDGEKLVFLPDIERKLNAIPRHLLAGNKDAESHESHESQQIVLYNLPQSLSLPEGQDNVRKAILEARRRAGEKHAQAQPAAPPSRADGQAPEDNPETAHGYDSPDYFGDEDPEPDPDAMDIS